MKTKIKYQINKKIQYEKIREKIIRKQNNRYINCKELQRSYAELQNKLKTIEEGISTNDSENKTNVYDIEDGFKN